MITTPHSPAARLAHYLRDRTEREVDFLVTLGRKPWFAVEAKTTETAIDPSLTYFRDRLRIALAYQVVLVDRWNGRATLRAWNLWTNGARC